MKVVGICGYKGSGKSVVAQYLAENYKFKRVNFKDALVAEVKERFPDLIKAMIDIMDKVAYDGVEHWTADRLIKDKPDLMRTLLQNYGTEVRRKDDADYWARQWTEKLKEVRGNIVTDDVRFYNELSALTEEDGILIRVVREDITEGGTHQSEKEQEKFIEDFTIVAKKGDLLGVYKQIDQIMHTIKAD